MDLRPDTSSSSGRFRGQWSFLANPPQHAQRPHSLPPSSYLPQSERSVVSPLPTNLHHHHHRHQTANGSRSSGPRNLTTASIGGRSSCTIPTQPVLIRVHSADASAHTNPAPRPRRPITMGKSGGLPATSEFSIRGILAAIQEDVESDINTISEILGRSRFVLADQHDSHMPPQGEIRALPSSLQAVEEIDVNFEDLASDDVLILRDDANLVEGSQTGSAAYGLLERLQAIPRTTGGQGHWQVSEPFHNSSVAHTVSSPPALHSDLPGVDDNQQRDPHRNARNLLLSALDHNAPLRTTSAVVSESHLSAEARGGSSRLFSNTFDMHHEMLENEHRDYLSEPRADGPQSTFRERMQNLLYVSDPTGLSAWLQGQSHGGNERNQSAECHLRDLLEK